MARNPALLAVLRTAGKSQSLEDGGGEFSTQCGLLPLGKQTVDVALQPRRSRSLEISYDDMRAVGCKRWLTSGHRCRLRGGTVIDEKPRHTRDELPHIICLPSNGLYALRRRVRPRTLVADGNAHVVCAEPLF